MAEFGPPEITDINAEIRRKTRIRLPGQKRAAPAHHPLAPDEQKSVLREVGNLGVGGLQYLGETLDKPARIIRGLATGNYREAGNLVPFSDTLGLTDPGKATSGKDLLQHYGLQNKGAEGLGASAAGLGAEILTDPLSYLSLGASAVGKAGKVAKAAGVSVKGTNRLKTLEQGLVGASIPQIRQAVTAAKAQGTTLKAIRGEQMGGAFGLTTGPLGLLGLHGNYIPKMAQGAGAEAALEGLGKAGKAIGNAPGIREAKVFTKGLFDPTAGGHMLGDGATHAERLHQVENAQSASKYAYEAKHGAQAKAAMAGIQAADDLDEIGKAAHDALGQKLGTSPEETAKLLRATAQLAGEQRRAGGQVAVGHALKSTLGANPGEGIRQKLTGVVEGLVNQQDQVAQSIKSKGGDIRIMFEHQGESPIGHFGRFAEDAGKGSAAYRQPRELRTSFEGALPRRSEIRHVPGNVLNKMRADKELGSTTDTFMHQAMLEKKFGPDIQRAFKAGTQRSIEEAAAKGIAPEIIPHEKTLADISDWLREGKGKFVEDAALNHGRYMRGAHLADANLDAIHRLMHDNVGPGGIPLAKAVQQIGLTPEAVTHFAQTYKLDPAQVMIHPDAVAGARSFLTKSQSPEWAHAITNATDTLTAMFKRNVTLPFMSFLTRNFASGQGMNFFSNEIPSIQHAMKYMGEVRFAKKILDDPVKFKAMLDEFQAHKVFDANDIAALGTELGWTLHRTPNPVSPTGFARNFKQGIAGASEVAHNPESMLAGAPNLFKKFRTAAGAPAQIGAEFNKQVEFLNRVPMYTYLRKHLGWGPEQAAAKVRELQVDYSALAPFEKQVMRRMVPFYSYARRTMPVMLKQMAERPGGVTAQVVRASNTGRSENEFVPPYVGEGMSVKLGEDKYLSQLGLPTDQFSDLFAKGPTALGTLKRTGQKALAMTNPIVKGPLEVATGQNFFTGRPLAESYPHPTNNQLANQVLHNTPLSRAFTTARQLDDGRKDWLTKTANLATGLRVTDVSGGIEKQQRIAESKILQEMLREDPNIATSVDVYPKRDQTTGEPKKLSPESERLYRAFLGIKRAAADEAKKKKKQLALQP